MIRCLCLCLMALMLSVPVLHAQSPLLLSDAIQWRWPGARVVIRGDVLERWDGPMARPTDAEITQAVTDYQAVAVEVRLETAVTTALDTERLSSAIVWTILKQMYPADTDAQTKTKYGIARRRIVDAYKATPWK